MINVFIGSEPSQADAEQVLLRSISGEHDLNVITMRAGDPFWDDWYGHGPTQFTLFRFAIPELMSFKGFAIYLDCDMLMLGNVSVLFDQRLPGMWNTSRVGGADGDAVSVIDCASVKRLPHWPSIAELKAGGLKKWDVRGLRKSVTAAGIPDTWNVHDEYVEGTQLIHYTNLETQPWLEDAKPHRSPVAVKMWNEAYDQIR